jgi:hypothetical protein
LGYQRNEEINFSRLVCNGFLISGVLISEVRLIRANGRKSFAIEEPLLIEGEKQNSYSVLPAGSVLYLDKSWPEGHDTYHVYFHFKGDFKATPVDSDVIVPVWLRSVDSSELGKLVSDYPISRGELAALLKAKRITKQDLAQILHDWVD